MPDAHDSSDSPANASTPNPPDSLWRVANDLKHAFGLLAGPVEALPQYLLDGAPARQVLAELRWTLAHIEHLTTRLLDSIRTQTLDRKPIDLNAFIDERDSLWKRALAPGVSLTVRLAATSGLVLATESELEWLLLALIANASAAIPTGGDVTIGTGWLDHVPGGIDPRGVRPSRFVRLTVSDTGDGREHDAQLRLLRPFEARVSGDADALRDNVVSVVRRLQGWMILESETRAGSRAHVCLPCLPEGSPES
jgi:two-component system, cell cycle sensor histidine kinase and response regulator CckA